MNAMNACSLITHEFIIKPFIYVKLHNQKYLLFIGWHNQTSDGMEYGLYIVL